METKISLTSKEKCKNCLYVTSMNGMNACGYMLETGNHRETEHWEDCYLHEGTEYVPRNGNRKKKEIALEKSKRHFESAGLEREHMTNFEKDDRIKFIDKLKRRYNDVQR